MNYLKTIFFSRREGVITLTGAAVYLVIFILHRFAPSLSPVPWFYGMLSPYIVFAIAITYLQMGGFKRGGFESGWFNTSIITFVALAPPMVAVNSLLGR